MGSRCSPQSLPNLSPRSRVRQNSFALTLEDARQFCPRECWKNSPVRRSGCSLLTPPNTHELTRACDLLMLGDIQYQPAQIMAAPQSTVRVQRSIRATVGYRQIRALRTSPRSEPITSRSGWGDHLTSRTHKIDRRGAPHYVAPSSGRESRRLVAISANTLKAAAKPGTFRA